MKSILLSIVLFLACLFSLQAQTLYGTTYGGGDFGRGTINKFIPGINKLTVVKSFGPKDSAANVTGSLVQATDGKLYGMTTNGPDYFDGYDGDGVIFSFDPASSTYTKLKRFDIGDFPRGSLMQANDGKLYGMTYGGGVSNLGTIFSFDPFSLVYTKLADFVGNSYGSLIQARNGNLYGMFSGDNVGEGGLFSFDLKTLTLKTVVSFDDNTGSFPYGNLLQAGDGELYGMTSYAGGGGYGQGVIFSFDPASSVYTKLVAFELGGINGSLPFGSLIQAANGKLYGMTDNGGTYDHGVIFSYEPSSSTYTRLKDFDSTDGSFPEGTLLQASDGKLYGTTNAGGTSNLGVIFSYDTSAATYTKLQDYTGANGSIGGEVNFFSSAFIEVTLCKPGTTYYKDADGDGYGGQADSVKSCLAPAGYAAGNTDCNDDPNKGGAAVHPGAKEVCNGIDDNCDGQIDEGCSAKPPTVKIITPGRDTSFVGPATILLSADARDPDGTIKSVDFYDGNQLIFTEDKFPYSRQWDSVPTGSYHITAVATDNTGLKTTSATVHLIVVHKRAPLVKITGPLDGSNYRAPATIVLSADVVAHGTRIGSVDFYKGTTLLHTEKNPPYLWNWNKVAEGNYTIIARATDVNGLVSTSAPVTVTVRAHDVAPVTLYGATEGLTNGSTINKFLPAANDLTTVHSFAGKGTITGGIVQASNGKLYGMTVNGGSRGAGVVYSYDLSSSTYTELKDFDSANGASPYGGLIQASDGKLYGMTAKGGSSDYGVIFSFDPSSSVYRKLKDFNGKDGAYPFGDLMQASDGKLYGMTRDGGEGSPTNYDGLSDGVIFSFDPSTAVYKKLVDFDNFSNGNPYGALIQAKDGKLYGMTYENGGDIFSYDISSSAYTVLKAFQYDGAYPIGSLIQANDGKLYGTTSGTRIHYEIKGIGGTGNTAESEITDAGVIFSFDLSTSTYTKLKEFNNVDGETPGDLMQASDGLLYGTTFEGGEGIGNIFSFDPASSAFTNLKDYNDSNGAHPQAAFIEVISCKTGYTYFKDADGDGYGGQTDSIIACIKLKGYVANNWDCNDSIASVHPNGDDGCTTNPAIVKVPSGDANSAAIVISNSVRLSSAGIETTITDKAGIKLSPNPAHNTLTIYTTGFQKDKPSTLTLISSSGVTLQTKQLNNLTPTIQLNISSLTSGMYIIKMISGDKVMYRQFMKM